PPVPAAPAPPAQHVPEAHEVTEAHDVPRAPAEPGDGGAVVSDAAAEGGIGDSPVHGPVDATVDEATAGSAVGVDGAAPWIESAADEAVGEGAAPVLVVDESDVDAVRTELARDMGVIFSRATV